MLSIEKYQEEFVKYLEEYNIVDAIKLANKNATLVVQKRGVTTI